MCLPGSRSRIWRQWEGMACRMKVKIPFCSRPEQKIKLSSHRLGILAFSLTRLISLLLLQLPPLLLKLQLSRKYRVIISLWSPSVRLLLRLKYPTHLLGRDISKKKRKKNKHSLSQCTKKKSQSSRHLQSRKLLLWRLWHTYQQLKCKIVMGIKKWSKFPFPEKKRKKISRKQSILRESCLKMTMNQTKTKKQKPRHLWQRWWNQ